MIVDQLKAYCDCVEDITDADVAELVNIISLATCWVTAPPKPGEDCPTFLKGARREVMDLPSCADCPVIFEPYYRPFDETSFKFYLLKIEGIEETMTEITDFAYSEIGGVFRVNTGLPSCKCTVCDPCGCPPEYKLVVTYEAGYDELPECLLPVFCHVLEVIKARRECECCNDCGCEGQELQVKYASGDVVSVQLETEIGQILVQNYKNQIGMISLCRGRKYLWGFVV